MTLSLFARCLALLLASSALACRTPPPADPAAYATLSLPADTPGVLRELTGSWLLDGTVQGEEVQYTLDGRWILGGAFLELTMTDTAEPPGYEARIFLGRGEEPGSLVAHWLDVFGGGPSKTVGFGEAMEQRLELRFAYDSAPFRDLIELDPTTGTGRFLITFQTEDGTWQVFGDQRMRRR